MDTEPVEEVAEVAEVAGTAPRKTRKKRTTVKKQPSTVKEWLEAKVRFPKTYLVSPDGRLISPPSNPGEQEKLIVIEPRIPAPIEFIEGKFKERSDAIKTAEEQFTEARRSLQRTIEAFRKGMMSASDVVIANQQVKEAETVLMEQAVQPRSIYALGDPTPEVRQIRFENPYLKNKVSDPVYVLQRTTFPWTYFYGSREELQGAEEGKEVSEGKEDGESESKEGESESKEEDEAKNAARVAAIIRAKTAKRKLVMPANN